MRSFLAANPLKRIEGFAITTDNYLKGVEILKNRYGKENLLINVHMNKLLSIPFLKYSSDIKTPRKFYDEIQTKIRSLESLNISLDTYGCLLCPILLKKKN